MQKFAIFVVAVVVLLVAASQLGGCYYLQAVNGQLELMRKSRPIPEVLEDDALPEATRRKLDLVLAARRYAVDELKLPDNDSYGSYADLEREFVVWNVFAAPEFSLRPKTWCFPVVGCVAYRGYFSEDAARKHADNLAGRGYDVYVGGVPAYSTLGRFEDPVLNTMMRWSDTDLVATLFHELAHQRLFVKGDTAFNEAFATAVAEFGLERWLALRDTLDEMETYRRRATLRAELMALAESTRSDLDALYARDLDDEQKRRLKTERLAALSAEAAVVAEGLGFANAAWLQPPLNNARLASVTLYRGNLPALRRMLADCRQDLECFYAEADRLAALPAAQRAAALDAKTLDAAAPASDY
jgi:predicted aminopeptidase